MGFRTWLELGVLTTSYMRSPEEELARTWHKDMIWFGPAGIGATYTRERYEKQHPNPFRAHQDDIAHGCLPE